MINKNIIVPVLAVLLLLAPIWVSAEVLWVSAEVLGVSAEAEAEAEEDWVYTEDGITGTATLGGSGVSVDNRSFKFGEYNGLEDDGGFVEFGPAPGRHPSVSSSPGAMARCAF